MTSISVFTRRTSPTGRRLQDLGHDKNFVSPGILNFAPRRVTAHVNVSARIKWTKHVSRLVRHCLGGWERGGRLRRRRWFWFGLRGFAVGDRRSFPGRLLRSCLTSLVLWLRRRGHLRRCSRVTRLGHIGFDEFRPWLARYCGAAERNAPARSQRDKNQLPRRASRDMKSVLRCELFRIQRAGPPPIPLLVQIGSSGS